MAGYTRVDTSNNIADGNVISAADLDNEFDGIQAAFNASTGHNHDGTTGEGAPILVLGPTQDVVVGASTVTPKTTNTVDIGSSSLKFKDLYLAGNASIAGTLGVTGATTLSAALTYGGVTLSNAVTGTGNMVLSASPTLTGTISGANASLSGTLAVTGVATLTAQPILSSLTASRAVFTDGSKGLVSNAITGTGNVVMSASPTLTGTISAEALTTSSTVTHNGGTANGVAYLNGSKVLTTGSALTYNGTGLGVGVSSAAFALDVGGADGTNIALSSTGTSSARFRAYVNSAESGVIGFLNGGGQFFEVAGTEGMRLTSTGLGIGTSSPAYKLDVRGVLGSGNGTITTGFSYDSGGLVGTFSNHALGILTNGNVIAKFDTSGNLGLGVTPSAWESGWKGFEFKAAGNSLFSGGNADVRLTSGAYYNAGWKYGVSGSAVSYYFQGAGVHSWYTAPSGTAGNAISFTQAATLTAGGDFLVGTTSAAGKITIAQTASSAVGLGVDIQATSTKFCNFTYQGSVVGSISYNGTLTVYATTSDYRLKNVLGAVTDAGARIDALEPIEYELKSDGSRTRGFLAHKFQEVYPQSVTGEKDAVDAEGNPVYQQMQSGTNEVIADLVAEIQSLRQRLAAAGI